MKNRHSFRHILCQIGSVNSEKISISEMHPDIVNFFLVRFQISIFYFLLAVRWKNFKLTNFISNDGSFFIMNGSSIDYISEFIT